MRSTTRTTAVLAALALVTTVASATAKPTPDEICRKEIGIRTGNAINKAALGPKAVKCLSGGGTAASCLDSGAVGTQITAVNFKCTSATCTRDLYTGTIDGGVATGIIRGVTAGADLALQSVSVGSDKAKTKCRKAIAAAFAKTAKAYAKSALGCEKAAKRSCSPLAADCLNANVNTSGATTKLAKACGSLTGADVGSCSNLPSCVVDAAKTSGQQAVKRAFGGRATCGDGNQDDGEQCDDGNTVNTDGCTAQCKTASCGDGITRENVEQCDDGNNSNTDGCTTACQSARCGDGFVQDNVEACDDGNTVDGDACSNACQVNAIACGAGGLDATVELVVDGTVGGAGDIAGLEVNVGYPGAATIPGTASDDTVLARVTYLIPDTSTDDFVTINDQDGNSLVRTIIVQSLPREDSAIQSGDILRVRFDCGTGASFLPSQFPCTITGSSDSLGISLTNAATCTVRIAANQGS